MIQDFYKKLSDKEKRIFYIAAGAVILALFDSLFVRPVVSKLNQLDEDIAGKSVSIEKDTQFLSYKEKIFKEKELYEQFQMQPEGASEKQIIAEFLRTIEFLADESQVSVVKLHRSEEISKKKGHVKYFANLECEAKLPDMITFMHKIDSTGNLLRIRKFVMTGNKTSPNSVKASVKIAKLIIDPEATGEGSIAEVSEPPVLPPSADGQSAAPAGGQQSAATGGQANATPGGGVSGEGAGTAGGAGGSDRAGGGSAGGSGGGGAGGSGGGAGGSGGGGTTGGSGGGTGGSGGGAGGSGGGSGGSGGGSGGSGGGAGDSGGGTGGSGGGGAGGSGGGAGGSGGGTGGSGGGGAGGSGGGAGGSGGGAGGSGGGAGGSGGGAGGSGGGAGGSGGGADYYVGSESGGGDGSGSYSRVAGDSPAKQSPREDERQRNDQVRQEEAREKTEAQKKLDAIKGSGRVHVENLGSLFDRFFGSFWKSDDKESPPRQEDVPVPEGEYYEEEDHGDKNLWQKKFRN